MPKFDHSISDPEFIKRQQGELNTEGESDCRCKTRIYSIIGTKLAAITCLYCDESFCLTCAEDHFGMTREQWKLEHEQHKSKHDH